jgi:hypothetical protein
MAQCHQQTVKHFGHDVLGIRRIAQQAVGVAIQARAERLINLAQRVLIQLTGLGQPPIDRCHISPGKTCPGRRGYGRGAELIAAKE